jgi:hypothetical protein
MRKVSVLSLLMLIASLAFPQKLILHISPTGNDLASGTNDQPLRSLESARNKIRQLKLDTHDTIQVLIKGGKYHMTSTFRLSPEDSGSPVAPIIYEALDGEKVIFSGGRELTGFTELENGLWAAHIPEVTYWNWTFDQLYVNGKRAQRAKSPNSGFFYLKDVKEEVWVQGTGRSPEKARQVVKVDDASSAELESLQNDELSEVVMIVYHHWNITKRHIDQFDDSTSTIFTSGQGMKPWNPWKPGKRFILENYLGALDNPGEWFLDANGTLFYKPFPKEKIETSTFTVPVLEQLISIEGDAASGSFVENIIFKNLQFQHTAFNLPKEGFEPYQAAITIDAAIELNGAKNIRFVHCQLAHTGGYGIWLNQGVSNSEINHCYLHDLGAGGIRIGETTLRAEANLQTGNNLIDNNIISGGGYDFPTAVGVLIGHSANNQITHNDIGNFRYTGVSVGWSWGYHFSPAKGNKILNNHIHHIGWGLLSDMAGVYTLGLSEGTEVSNNHIHHIYAYDYGGWGLYTDEGSSDIVMENNLVHHTKTGGFHQHYGRENTIRNNIFAFSKMYQIQATRVEDHLSFAFANNIVLYDEGVLYRGSWSKMNVEIDKNIYWNMKGDVIFTEKSFKTWQKNGYDKQSFVENPQFKDPMNGDFSFKNKRTYKKIGFKPFDYEYCGVYGSEDWKNKAKLPEKLIEEFDKLFD